eukprot:scaffold605_cov400-Prasinococcus_capsulatus_cf.AAC.4
MIGVPRDNVAPVATWQAWTQTGTRATLIWTTWATSASATTIVSFAKASALRLTALMESVASVPNAHDVLSTWADCCPDFIMWCRDHYTTPSPSCS